ncbi:MAG: hypothetical protein GF331_27320 [Chitinivibrionales bacterium]|nr:hypothetical protein [Chitinivibrionales bacterium]
MKRMARIGGTLVLASALMVGAFAQQDTGDQYMNGREDQKRAWQDSAKKEMMGVGCAVMLTAPQKVIQVRDGIIVLVGNKLIKYNNNLEKVAEVTVEVNADEIRQWLDETKELCKPDTGNGATEDGTMPEEEPTEPDTGMENGTEMEQDTLEQELQ